MKEGTLFDRKSLKTILGKTADFNELAKDCVAFANAKGGHIHIGIEDDCLLPPDGQVINQTIADKLVRRMNELTFNVAVHSEICKAENGSDFIDLEVFPSLHSIASTSKGGYFYRDDDKSRPLLPDELHRLLSDKPSYCWETKVSLKYKVNQCDKDKLNWLLISLRNSDRVSDFVKEKSDDQLLEYYSLVDENGWLTNLGVMWIGTQMQRSRLLYSPIVQYLKYDEDGNRVNKIVWDDHRMNPAELLSDIWNRIPDWREFIEVSEGLWRKQIANYDEKVVREVLCNAIVHRPYTTRGDIFINLYPDRMEIVNPGLFPIGVTPDNILQKRVKRNELLARLCFALHLMEGEGSGYDLMYETLLTAGKTKPIPFEGDDYVKVTVNRKIGSQETVRLCDYIISHYETTQKGRIALGLILESGKLSASELSKLLQLNKGDKLSSYIGRLVDDGIVDFIGRGKGTRYFVTPKVVANSRSNVKTSLKTIEPYRLRALILEDLRFHPNSLWSEIAERLPDVDLDELQQLVRKMALNGDILSSGGRRYRKYRLP